MGIHYDAVLLYIFTITHFLGLNLSLMKVRVILTEVKSE